MRNNNHNLTNFLPPTLTKIKKQSKTLHRWFPTTLQGIEHVDEKRPALYVGNHTLLGHDVPPLIFGLYTQKNIFLRSVGDHAHFRIPLWRSLIKHYGAFDGTRDAIQQLMQKKEHILIFPGGGREVMKNKGEAYQLIWKNRFGFVELALENGYDIIPFAAIGGEEMFDLKYDSNEFKKSLLGKFLQRVGIMKRMRNGEGFIPLATGFLGLPFIPRKKALEYTFFPRIETRHIPKEQHSNIKIELRQQVADSINTALEKHRK